MSGTKYGVNRRGCRKHATNAYRNARRALHEVGYVVSTVAAERNGMRMGKDRMNETVCAWSRTERMVGKKCLGQPGAEAEKKFLDKICFDSWIAPESGFYQRCTRSSGSSSVAEPLEERLEKDASSCQHPPPPLQFYPYSYISSIHSHFTVSTTKLKISCASHLRMLYA